MILLQCLETVRPALCYSGVPTQSFILRGASPKVPEHGHTTPLAYELASDTRDGLGVMTMIPSTTRRQVTRNALNNSGDSTPTMVPLYRGLSGTKITLGRRWKSRGQVGQTMDVTGGFIYYLYLFHDSSLSHLL